MLEPALASARREAISRRTRRLRIVEAELGDEAGLIGAALVGFEALDGSAVPVPLAVCATPIGNLEDVTLRVLAELREADVVLCEDTRHTRGPARSLRHRGAEAAQLSRAQRGRRRARALPRLAAGERMALVSDAGLPGVNDPGAG